MNDYLTQLVTRNLGTANVVQLRPTALFAPERAVEPLGEAGAFLDAPAAAPARQADRRPSAEPARHTALPTPAEPPPILSEPARIGPRQRPISDHPARSITPLDDTAPPADVAPRRTPAAIAPLPAPPFSPQPAPKEPAPPAHGRSKEPAPPAHGRSKEPAPAAAPEPSVIERTTVISPPPAQLALQPSVADERPTLVDSARITDSLRPAPLIVTQPPAARDPQPPPAPLIMPQPSVTVIQPARRAPPAAAQAAAATEPTIHVTIGRIEVRATPAATPTARPRSAQAPTTSLDDYLRERGGGRR